MVVDGSHRAGGQLRRRELLPELSGGANWPFELVGAAFAVIGVVFMVYGYVRHDEVDRALDRGEYAGLSGRAAFLFALAGGILGLATLLLVALRPA